MSDLTAVSLFSGVGGLDLGVERAGFRVLLQAESDSYRRDVLRARFPGAELYEDVRAIGEPPPRTQADERGDEPREGWGETWARILGGRDLALLCGGFPCQDLSVAGRREGLAGERSSLFYEYARVAESLRPRWLLVENVPGLLSSQGGRDFGAVLGTLADIGYGLAWRVLDSRFFGVPQRRRRVFIVGTRADGDPRAAAERAGAVLAVGTRCPRHPATRGETREDVAEPSVASTLGGRRGFTGDDIDRDGALITHALTSEGHDAGEDGTGRGTLLVAAPLTYSITLASDPISTENLAQPSTRRNGDPGVVSTGAAVRRLTPTECERLQAFPDGWTQLGTTADSKRYAALGDAVTVTVAHWIASRIAAELKA